MSKKETTTVHTILIGNQGAHIDNQGGPRFRQRYEVWKGRFREGDTYEKRKKYVG